MDFKTLKKEDSEAWAVDREDNYFETHTLKARKRRTLEEICRREEAAAEAKTKAQLEAFEKRRARDRSEASAAAKEALRREATRVLKAQEREKQKAVREAREQRERELKAAKALAQREREDAERARHVPYSCANVLCFVGLAVAAFLMRNSLCSLLVKLATVLIVGGVFALVALVVGVFALIVLAQWMHPSELTTCSRLLLAGFVVLSLLHLTVFVNATSAMYQGSTYPGFQAVENCVDSRASGPQESVLMQFSPATFLRFVHSLAWVVLIALNLLTNDVLFLGLAVACCVGVKPYALAQSVCLASIDSYVASEFALLLLVYVGRPLGLRLDVRAYAQSHFFCGWAGLAFGSFDVIWRGGDLNWNLVTLLGGGASSTRSWIGGFISSMASWLYSEGSEVVSLWPELIASLICIFAISTVIDQFSEHLVVRLVCFFGGPYLVNATGDPWILIKQALAVICIEGLALYVTSSRVASTESTSGIGHSCFTRLVTAFKWFFYWSVLWRSSHLGSWFEMFGTASSASGDAIATYLTRGTACTGSVNVYAVLSVASGTGPVVVAIVLVACSSWAALRDRHCLEGGGSFISSVGTAATTFALFIYGLVLWYSGHLGSWFEMFGTASSASGDAIATVFTRGTAYMGSLHVYAVLFVTLAVVGVLRVRDAKPHVPNDVPGAFASNTCKDTCCGAETSFFSGWPTFGTSFFSRGPTFQIWAKDEAGESIPLHVTASTTVENLKQMIWEKVGIPAAEQRLKFAGKMLEDGRTCSDYLIQKASTLDLFFRGLGGGKTNVYGSWCDKCKQWQKNRGFNIHYKNCGVSRASRAETGTTAPDGYQQSLVRCVTCCLGRRLVDSVLCGVCKHWGQKNHLGHADYAAFFQTKQQEQNDQERAARAATSGGQSGKSTGDDRTKWNETYPGASNGETRNQFLENYIKAFPRWRLSPQQPLCEMLAQRLGVDGWVKVRSVLSLLDPANVAGYRSNLRYEAFVNACLALVNFDGGDPMFGGLDPLTMVLLGGLVSGAIALEAATLIRAMKSPQRRNAAGTQSRKGVRQGIYNSACRAGNELAAALLENDRRSGLRGIGLDPSSFYKRWGHLGGFDLGLAADCLVVLRDRGVRIFQIAPHGLSSFIGCDFGNLAKQDTVLQAFNVKALLDLAVGNSTTRTISRPGNNAIAVGLSALTGTESLELHIKLHAGLIIVYTGLGGINWKAKVIAAYQHFSETYDPEVFKQKMKFPRCWDTWLKGLMCPNDWGGVIDGYDICFFINDALFGRDLLSEPMDVAIYDATDRNLERIARGISWDLSYLPNDDWPGVQKLRQSCLEACMGAADNALMLYYVVFKQKLEAALESGTGVCAVVTACYEEIKNIVQDAGSAEAAIAAGWRTFYKEHAPGILADLAEPRRVDILTYDGRDLEEAPVPSVKTVDRATSLAAAAAPAPPALQPHNVAKRGSSADAGGDAKRPRCPADMPMAL